MQKAEGGMEKSGGTRRGGKKWEGWKVGMWKSKE
jgi:hypothetical protein